MYTTLDRLEKIHTQKKRKKEAFLRELKVITIIVSISALFILIFTNAQLFFWWIIDGFSTTEKIIDWNKQNSSQDNSISHVVSVSNNELKKINTMIDKFKEKNNITIKKELAPSSQSELKSKTKEYPFDFNTLPPTNRLIIPSKHLDVPLITSKYKGMEDFNNGKFDTELNQWVVKYPTTPKPWEPGNTLIFGHTSTEYRKKNPYGTIFKDIPDLQNNEEIKLVWNGELHSYKIVDHRIVYPKDVNKTYLEFQNKGKDYVTLMWCYPIGTSKKRYLVIAEETKD